MTPSARQQPNKPHTNPKALQEGTWDHTFVHRTLTTERERELHDHYARNALACGHSVQCLKAWLPVNWPTMWGKPLCTCGRGEPWIHPDHRAEAA